jgi:siroheme synthase-like protein
MRLPTVLNLDGPVVVFGGGDVGLSKVEYLLRFTSNIIVVAEDVQTMPEPVKSISVRLKANDIETYIPDGTSLVVAALSAADLNHAIAKFCRKKGILINVVDDPEFSTIFFPALSDKGDLNIAISTSGKCPFLAGRIRIEVDEWVSEKAGWLKVLVPIREKLAQNPEKMDVLAAIYEDPEIKELVAHGEIEKAIIKAREIFDVYCDH